MVDARFWMLVDTLVHECEMVIDRPRGSQHPRYHDVVYPLDYGHLAGTHSGNGDGIDVWSGRSQDGGVTGAIVTIDLLKRDAEIKLLVDCTQDEAAQALAVHQSGSQGALLILRDTLLSEGSERA